VAVYEPLVLRAVQHAGVGQAAPHRIASADSGHGNVQR